MVIFVFHQGQSSHFNHRCRWLCCSSLCSTVALQHRCRIATDVVRGVNGQNRWIAHQWHFVITDMAFLPQERAVHVGRCERSEHRACHSKWWRGMRESVNVFVCVDEFCCSVINQCFVECFYFELRLWTTYCIFMLSAWCVWVCVWLCFLRLFFCSWPFVYVTRPIGAVCAGCVCLEHMWLTSHYTHFQFISIKIMHWATTHCCHSWTTPRAAPSILRLCPSALLPFRTFPSVVRWNSPALSRKQARSCG